MDYVELSLSEQMKYAKSYAWQTRIQFATYPAILPEVADFMIENEKDPKVLDRICERIFRKSNSNIWATTLAKAAKKKVELCGVAKSTDPETLVTDQALIGIALHLNTNVETLKYLYALGDNHINWGIANNPNTPKAILIELANIGIFDIDEALLHNPNAPEEIKPMILERYPNGFFSCGYYYDIQGIKVEASGN